MKSPVGQGMPSPLTCYFWFRVRVARINISTAYEERVVAYYAEPYKTQKYHEIDYNLLKIDRLRGNLIGVLSGSKTLKWVYVETI